MKKDNEFVFEWKKAPFYGKLLFIIGWTGVLNIFFWIFVFLVHRNNKEKKFWNKHTYTVPYIFGIITLIFLFFSLII